MQPRAKMEVSWPREQPLLRFLEPLLIAMVGVSWSVVVVCIKSQCLTIRGCSCMQQPTVCTMCCTLPEHQDPPYHLSASISTAPRGVHPQTCAEIEIQRSESDHLKSSMPAIGGACFHIFCTHLASVNPQRCRDVQFLSDRSSGLCRACVLNTDNFHEVWNSAVIIDSIFFAG